MPSYSLFRGEPQKNPNEGEKEIYGTIQNLSDNRPKKFHIQGHYKTNWFNLPTD